MNPNRFLFTVWLSCSLILYLRFISSVTAKCFTEYSDYSTPGKLENSRSSGVEVKTAIEHYSITYANYMHSECATCR